MEEEEDQEDMPGWGHWAMPHAPPPDMELHPGEFLELNDLMAPLPNEQAQAIIDNLPIEDVNSNITLSLALTNDSAPSAESANGPHNQPILHGLPDLNALNGPPLQILADGPPMEQAAIGVEPTIEGAQRLNDNGNRLDLMPDYNLEAIIATAQSADKTPTVDPMQLEVLKPQYPAPKLPSTIIVERETDVVQMPSLHPATEVTAVESTQQQILIDNTTCESNDSDLDAPPRFPIP